MARSPWQSKGWKEKRLEILSRRPKCEWCDKTTKLQIAHKDITSRWTPNYLELKDKDIMVLCAGCHLGHHKGLNKCPCGNWKRIRSKTCWTCRPKKEQESIMNYNKWMNTTLKRLEDEDFETMAEIEKLQPTPKKYR